MAKRRGRKRGRTSKMRRARVGRPTPPAAGRSRYWAVRYTDPDTGKSRQISTRQYEEDAAWEFAEKLAERLLAGEPAGGISWADFADLYMKHLRRKPGDRTCEGFETVCHWLREIRQPKRLADINQRFVAQWRAGLMDADLSGASVATYLALLRAALNWAVHEELLAKAPTIKCEWPEEPRGRAVLGEEFERMLAVVPKVRPRDAEYCRRFLLGLYHTGLRLGQLCQLSWDEASWVWLDASNDPAIIWIGKRAQKNRREDWKPFEREFWNLVCDEPRTGLVLPWPSNRRGGQMSRRTLQKIVSQVGARAGVVTNARTGKTATAHDLRRSFADRMVRKLGRDAKRATGHRSDKVLETYYRHLDASEVQSRLWSEGP